MKRRFVLCAAGLMMTLVAQSTIAAPKKITSDVKRTTYNTIIARMDKGPVRKAALKLMDASPSLSDLYADIYCYGRRMGKTDQQIREKILDYPKTSLKNGSLTLREYNAVEQIQSASVVAAKRHLCPQYAKSS